MGGWRRDRVRRRRRRGRVRRLRGGRAAVGGPVAEGAAARGRRFGRRPRGAGAGRALQGLAHPPRLELHDRAAARPRRPEALLAAREAARRVVVDQRDDLHARGRGRLRRVGQAHRRLLVVLRLGAADLPAHGGQRPRSGPLPRRRRPAAGRGPALAAPVDARRHPVRGRGRLPAQRRLQRGHHRGRRPVPGDPAARPALVGRRRLPAPRDGPAEPDRPDRRADHPRAGRERPGHRRRVPLRRKPAHRPREPRGRALRRRGELPAAADAVGHRPGRSPARGRRRRRPRPARCRRGAAGPPAGAGHLARPLGQVAVPRRVAVGLREVVRRPPRPAHVQPRRGRAVHPLDPGRARARPADALPAGEVLAAGRGRSRRRRVHRRRRAGARALAGLGPAAFGRPDLGAGHRRRLPHRRAGPRRAGLRRREGPGDRLGRSARGGAGGGVVAGRHGARARRAPAVGARHPRVAVPPGVVVPDGHRRGLRRRPAADGARHRGPADRRRLDHADAGAGQHERAVDPDRRAGRRPDPRAAPSIRAARQRP